MLFIRQNGDDSRPKNAATCPAFLDKICVKFGRTMNRHILLFLQKTIDSCVNYFLDQAKKQTILAVNVCAKIGRKTATMKNKNGNDLSKLSFWKSTVKTIHWLFRHENAVFFSTYKPPSAKSLRMYNVTFLEIRNVKTRLYALTFGPKRSR